MRQVKRGRLCPPILNLRKVCTDLIGKASANMVLVCTLAGLAYHALYMHRVALSGGHTLGLTDRFCQITHVQEAVSGMQASLTLRRRLADEV